MRRCAVVLALVLSACAAKPAPAPGVKVDPALATLVPADTVLLVGARVEALQKYLADVRFQPLEDFAKQAGVDPRKDLLELLYVSNGRKGVLLGRGKSGVVGETAAVKSHGPPPALAALMKEIPPDSQVWAAYTGGSLDLAFDNNVTKVLSSLENGSVYFDLRAGLNGVASGLCSTEQSAQDVAGALKVLIALGRLDQSIRVTQDARRVKMSIEAPQELVEKYLDLWIRR